MASDRPLSAKQRAFVSEFIKDRNATQSALRAGYAQRSAAETGSRLLRHPVVQGLIEIANQELAAKSKMSAEEVVVALSTIARGSLKSVADWGADWLTLKPSDDLGDEAAGLISEIKITPTKFGVSVGIKKADPLKALQILAEVHGLTKPTKEGGTPNAPASPAADGNLRDLGAAELGDRIEAALRASRGGQP